MRKLITAGLTAKIILVILALLLVFHVLVLCGVVPAGMIWGGQLDDDAPNIVAMELVALLVTLLFMGVVAAKLYYRRPGILRTSISIAVWLMFVYFVLNTAGNILSPGAFENYVFAPLTILLSLLLLRLGLEK